MSVLPDAGGILLLHGGCSWNAEFSETPFEVLIKKCIEDRIQATVCVP